MRDRERERERELNDCTPILWENSPYTLQPCVLLSKSEVARIKKSTFVQNVEEG